MTGGFSGGYPASRPSAFIRGSFSLLPSVLSVVSVVKHFLAALRGQNSVAASKILEDADVLECGLPLAQFFRGRTLIERDFEIDASPI